MGSGGVGGYFGARLAAAANDVTFIARGAHLEAIRNDGLRVTSPLGDVHVEPARATDKPAEVGPVDIVLFATKLYDTESAGEYYDKSLEISRGLGVDELTALTTLNHAELFVKMRAPAQAVVDPREHVDRRLAVLLGLGLAEAELICLDLLEDDP